MRGPKALDLFCGAGGVSEGLRRAGFEVTSVDLYEQPNHRGGLFIRADALEFPLEGFEFIWASPPCQAYSSLRGLRPENDYEGLISKVRERLERTESLWVIENVPGARRELRTPVFLCGASLGLGALGEDGNWRQLKRHRYFESNFFLMTPPCACDNRQKVGVYGSPDTGYFRQRGGKRCGYQGTMREKQEATGVDWMTHRELNNAIPPAYAELIGRQAIAALAPHNGAG